MSAFYKSGYVPKSMRAKALKLSEHEIPANINIFPYYWKGKKHTTEYKKKMSLKMKGRKVTWGEKVSKAKKGISTITEIGRMKLRQARLGKHNTEETNRKISETHKKMGKHVVMTSIVREKLRQAHLGTKLTKEHKLKISNGLIGRMPLNMIRTGMYPSIKSGNYDINGKNIFFRSKWEANYALYLDFLKDKKKIKNWQFEPDVFIFRKIKFGTRSYKPDFKIFKNNGDIEYHEIKGYMDKKSHTKIKRMKIYYPKIKLILIRLEEYNALKKWSKLLKWY